MTLTTSADPGTPDEIGGSAPDALDLEIFRYLVESVVDELDVNITRTAHSLLVYEYKDYAVGLLTSDFRMLSQSKNNFPIFLADLSDPVRDAVEVIGLGRLRPGDVFLTNYAAVNGSHLNNMVAAAPIHVDGEIAAYVAIRMHWPDVGGPVPGSFSWGARHILQEGVQYRGVKIVDAGHFVPELMATIQANSWMPRMTSGDAMAQIAACTLGVRRWQERVAQHWTMPDVAALIDAQFAASEALARAELLKLPDGVYEAHVDLDDSGTPGSPPLPMRVRVVLEGDRMTVDLSGLPPQVEAPINSGAVGGGISCVRVAFKSVISPDRPADHGLFAPLEVILPGGTLMSAENGAPMGWWQQPVATLIDLVMCAIGQGAPDRVPAGHHGSMVLANIGGTHENGERWVSYSSAIAGMGAHSEGDGFGPTATLMHGDNPKVADELTEARYPLRIHSRRLVRDAGGRGRYRGGPGVETIIETLVDAELSTTIDRTRDPAWGMAGGEAGTPPEMLLAAPGTDDWAPIGRLSEEPIAAGTRIRIRTAGGGGWGPPELRERGC